MSSLRAFFVTLVTSAAAILGGAIGLMFTSNNPTVAIALAFALGALIGIIYIASDALYKMEEDEKQDEYERQQEDRKMQRSILDELRDINIKLGRIRNQERTNDFIPWKGIHTPESYQQQKHIDAMNRLADTLDKLNLPKTERLETPENLTTEDDTDDSPPDDDNTKPQSKSSNG